MYQVVLTKRPTIDDFRSDYFPRKCRYKKDAVALVVEVVTKGGDAYWEKLEKQPKQQARSS